MKKVFFSLAVSCLIVLVSCTKETFPEPKSNIIFTDDPPTTLFSAGTPYGVTHSSWIDTMTINTAKQQGYHCINNNGNSYDCGQWYVVSARKYWGIIGDKIYVSKSKDWYAISPNVFLQALSIVRSKATGIGQLCLWGCQNPLGLPGMITWVQ